VKRQEPEKLLQESIVQYLSLDQRVPFLHPYYPRSLLEGKRAKRMGLSAGWPDLLFPAPGSLGLELKAPGGKQSIRQQWLQHDLEADGLVYVVAHSFDDAMEAIKKHCKWGYEEK
jgi:hypothetical protein